MLLASAGGGALKPLVEVTGAHLDGTFGRNVKGVLFTVQTGSELFVEAAKVIPEQLQSASEQAMPKDSPVLKPLQRGAHRTEAPIPLIERDAGEAKSPAGARRLEFLPVALFGSVMGLTGLSVAWRLAAARYGFPEWITGTIAVLAVLAFGVLAVAYLTKLVAAPDAVRAEFNHPIAGNLFGTMLISLLLLPIVIAPVALGVARVMWGIAAAAMLAFAWVIIDR